MKKLSVVLTGVIFSAFYFGIEYPAFAQSTHLIPGFSPFSGHNPPPRRLPYRFVTPTGSEIIVDFLRNPTILRAAEWKGLTLIVPRLRDEISNTETFSTFEPSKGIYQEVVTLAESGFVFDFFEFLIPPEGFAPFHTHKHGWEMFYVVGGDPANDCREDNENDCLPDNDEVIFKVNADTDGIFNIADPANPYSVIEDEEIEIQMELTKGSFAALPAGKTFSISNVGDKPARILALLTPGGGTAKGFRTVGAPAGIFKKLPALSPLTVPPVTDNENGNCSPTGNEEEVSCEVPENPEFYDFSKIGEPFPNLTDVFGWTPGPATIPGARCLVVYGSTGLKIDPSEDPNVSCPITPVSETNDPFSGSSFLNPFVLLTFGQSAGILTPAPLNAKLFGIGEEEKYFAKKSPEHELFRVLEGSVMFLLRKEFRLAKAGTSVFIPKGRRFGLIGTAAGAKVIQFSVSVPEEVAPH
jgi:mannose-6-phosphate isomerase-like protein (cupin superfamily)